MSRDTKAGSLTILLLFVILVISISNYFTVSKIEYHVISSIDIDSSNIISFFQSESIKELRKTALLNAENDRKLVSDASKRGNNQEFYKTVKVEAHCSQKERIGEKGDGGKYVCNPKKVKRDCTRGNSSNDNIWEDFSHPSGQSSRIRSTECDPWVGSSSSVVDFSDEFGKIVEHLERAEKLEVDMWHLCCNPVLEGIRVVVFRRASSCILVVGMSSSMERHLRV
ncbi:hypothetical protein GCK72_013317 [Caenorhabditis remanei]|uniref:Methyltransferase domain-containing protein n=1 Tax=Caenorhabditis remanei TaxID=31234 RepID=A0A6A5GQJ1_CAERE|nr:hypothetical protein GCK72_013317 [Caenorhabditis remanei]KAF1756863.1 hypothetical protein GCK72_013317 [Caenorhabditis remanei]